jgi:hypothetical protein
VDGGKEREAIVEGHICLNAVCTNIISCIHESPEVRNEPDFWRYPDRHDIYFVRQANRLDASLRPAAFDSSCRATESQKLLWYYDWATIGDSIMDLSQRLLIDPHISIDLCMPHGPVELFVRDARFRRVSRSLDDCDARYDTVIVQSLTTKTILKKIQYHPFTPWFSIMGHRRDENFSRIQLSYEQIKRVFKSTLESGPIAPTLTISD